jgi:hypothetical protein
MQGMVDTLTAFGNWLDASALGEMVTAYRWIWPIGEALHFVGLTMLFGTIGSLDLRVLGMAKSMPATTLHRLVPFGIAGFVTCAVTGFLFFAGEPSQYIPNGVFWIKMGFILLAGLNVAWFYVSDVHRQVEALGPGDDASPSAKFIAASSIVLWLGVMFWGRMLPFIGIAF